MTTDFESKLDEVRAGDTDAQNDFFDHWRAWLRITCRDLTGGNSVRADTSDVVQEGMMQAWQDLQRLNFANEAQYAAWLKQVGKGQAANLRRHHNAKKRDVNRDTILDNCTIHDDSLRPDEIASKVENWGLIIESLQRLSEDKQRLIYQHRFMDRPLKEIARESELSYSAIRKLYADAIKELGVAFEEVAKEKASQD